MKFGRLFTLGIFFSSVLAFAGSPRSAGAQGGEAQSGAPGFRKILFLGNSITLHGPNKKIGWEGNWGMAASSEDRDYVHLVARALAEQDGRLPEILVKNVAAFERNWASYDAAAELKDAVAFDADLIVVAVGENVPALASDEAGAQFAASLVRFLNGITKERKPLTIVRSCFWPNAAKDEALRSACQAVGGRFLDIGALGKDDANRARSERQFEHEGVANHPGDRGMQAIAGAIVDAVRQGGGS